MTIIARGPSSIRMKFIPGLKGRKGDTGDPTAPGSITNTQIAPNAGISAGKLVVQQSGSPLVRSLEEKVNEIKSIRDFAGSTPPEKYAAAVAYAQSIGGNILFDFPQGEYPFPEGSAAIITAPNVSFRLNGSVLQLGTGAMFRYGDGTTYVDRGRVSDLTAEYTGADSSSCLMRVYWGEEITLEKVRMDGGGYILDAGLMPSGKFNSNISLSDITGSVDNIAGIPAVRRGATNAFTMRSVNIYNKFGSGAETGRNFFEDTEGTISSLQMSNVLAERFYDGMRVISAGGRGTIDIFLNDVCMDSCYHAGAYFYSTGVGSFINSIKGCNNWFSALNANPASWGAFLGADSGGKIVMASLEQNQFYGGNIASLALSGACSYVNVDTPKSLQYEAVAAGAASILLDNTAGGMERISIRGGNLGVSLPSPVTSYLADYGIQIIGEPDFDIDGVQLAGAIAPVTPTSFGAGSPKRRIRNSTILAGSDYSGWKGTGIYALPASGTPWVNTTPFTTEIYIANGTVSQINLQDTVTPYDSDTGLTSGRFVVAPGESLTVTYSATPLMRFKVLP